MAISLLNPKAEVARAAQALAVNISAAKGIQDVMKTNLGPKGTMKMLVSGAGDIKITKDGNVLLHEMQIQHPTASLIARASTAQDDMTGDGTTSTVLLIGELLKQADIYVAEGLHPRLIAEGFDKAKTKALEVLDKIKVPIDNSKETLLDVCRTSLRTKVHQTLADVLTDVCVDAVLAIRQSDKPVDLHMIELMQMQHKTESDTTLVKGLVLDHGSRHPDMPKRLENCYVLTCNVSLEYEKSEVNSGFFYKTAEERDKMVLAEREFIDQRVKKVIELKRKLCAGNNKTFVLINQKGIDPMSLDQLAKEGSRGLVILTNFKKEGSQLNIYRTAGQVSIKLFVFIQVKRNHFIKMAQWYGNIAGRNLSSSQEIRLKNKGIIALRRAKRRNMERLALACGGIAMNTFDDLTESSLGYAGLVYEHILGENKFTFVEQCKNPQSVTILMKGPNKHSLQQIKDAIRDGLRAINNAIEDKAVIPGAGAFEITANKELMQWKDTIKGKTRLGVVAYAEALLVIPKVLATNSGFDVQETIVKLQEESRLSPEPIGLDLTSGEPISSKDAGIFDNYIVKKQIINSCSVIASNLLLVDEIMRAGMSSLKG